MKSVIVGQSNVFLCVFTEDVDGVYFRDIKLTASNCWGNGELITVSTSSANYGILVSSETVSVEIVTRAGETGKVSRQRPRVGCMPIPNIIDYGTTPPRFASTTAVYWLLVDAERGDIKEAKWGRDGWRMARRSTAAPRCANTSCVARNQPVVSASDRVRPRPPTRSFLLVSPY